MKHSRSASSKLILSNHGLDFVIAEHHQIIHSQRERLKSVADQRAQSEKDAEELKKRLSKEESDRKLKEARLKVISSKRAAITINQPINKSGFSPFTRGRFSISQNLSSFVGAAASRTDHTPNMAKCTAMTLGLAMSKPDRVTGKSILKLDGLKQKDKEELRKGITTNEQILKSSVEEISSQHDSGYIGKKTGRIYDMIKHQESQKVLWKKINCLRRKEPTNKDVTAQNLLMRQIQDSQMSEGFLKEIKEMQRLKKLANKHSEFTDTFKNQLKHNDKVWHEDNIERSRAGSLLDEMNMITSRFHDVIETSIKRGCPGKLPLINALNGMQDICRFKENKTYESKRHQKHTREHVMASFNIEHTEKELSMNRIRFPAPETLELVSSNHRATKSDLIDMRRGCIKNSLIHLHRPKKSLVFLNDTK